MDLGHTSDMLSSDSIFLECSLQKKEGSLLFTNLGIRLASSVETDSLDTNNLLAHNFTERRIPQTFRLDISPRVSQAFLHNINTSV